MHAGGRQELFTEEAYRSVYDHSSGIPRLINVLCDIALVYGYAEGVKEIGDKLMQDVIQDRSQGIQLDKDERQLHAPV